MVLRKIIQKLKPVGVGPSSAEPIGYMAFSHDTDRALAEVKAGSVQDNGTDAPPWLVVDHNLATITIPKWPITLWKVAVVTAIKPQGHVGNYTRCRAVRFLEKLPNYKVFGDTDSGIPDIISFAQLMTLAQAQALHETRSGSADIIRSKAWHRWAQAARLTAIQPDEDFANVLSIGRAYGDSPVRSGLLLLSRAVFDQAGQCDPDQAYAYETDGTPYLAKPWDQACAALQDAAMAFGASQYLTPQEAEQLSQPLAQVAPELVAAIRAKTRNP